MSDRISTRRSLLSLGIMLLLSGAAVMMAAFALPPQAQLAALGQIGAGLLLTGAVIYLAGLWREARRARAAAQAREQARSTAPTPAPVDPSPAA